MKIFRKKIPNDEYRKISDIKTGRSEPENNEKSVQDGVLKLSGNDLIDQSPSK